jgi:hypothetical protein
MHQLSLASAHGLDPGFGGIRYVPRVPGSDRDAADLLGGLLDPSRTPNVDRRRCYTNQRTRTIVVRRISVASWPTGAPTN